MIFYVMKDKLFLRSNFKRFYLMMIYYYIGIHENAFQFLIHFLLFKI